MDDTSKIVQNRAELCQAQSKLRLAKLSSAQLSRAGAWAELGNRQ